MTRVNVGIKPQELTDQHLLAEHREIKRIPSVYKKRVDKNKFDDIPPTFTLGTGHVLFFIDKGAFTLKRYLELHNECIRRGFKVQDYSNNWKIYRKEHMNDYIPTLHDRVLLTQRIAEKIAHAKIVYRHSHLAI